MYEVYCIVRFIIRQKCFVRPKLSVITSPPEKVPNEKAGSYVFTHMTAESSINKDIRNRNKMRGKLYVTYVNNIIPRRLTK